MHIATQSGMLHKSWNSIYCGFRNLNRNIFISLVCIVMAGCGGGGGGGIATVVTNLLGSVGDGPIIGATISITDANGNVVGTTFSDASASYDINVPEGTLFPVTITATGGTDIVTGTSPDFTMVSVALSEADLQSGKVTANINPFTTFIIKAAQSMPGGLTADNLTAAKQTLFQKFSFGLDSTSIADPISSDINATNVAGVVKASEALGEMIRRTRDAMISSGNNMDGDDVLNALANDLADGTLDGSGTGANIVISATANIVSAQVLVETISNRLKVNDSLATTLLDNAIQLTEPAASMTTAEVVLTDSVLLQTQSALAAAERFSPSAELSSLSSTVAGLTSNTLPADVNAVIAVGAEDVLDATIISVPLATTDELASINTASNTSTTPVAPVITTTASLTAQEGVTYSYDVNATDANAGDSLSYALTTAPAGMSINATSGIIGWTPTTSQVGSQNVTVRVTDNGSPTLSASQSFSITVAAVNVIPANVAPAITTTASLTAQESVAYSYDVNATDANAGDSLSYALTTAPAGMSINATNGIISWTPTTSQVGSQNVTVKVTDNGSPALSANQSFSITVAAANNTTTAGTIIRVNAGGGEYVDTKGQLWAADNGYNLGANYVTTNPIDGTADDALYQSERWHTTYNDIASPELEYSFNVPAGDYAIKLHFAEISTVTRIFDIEIENILMIDNLNIENEVGRNVAMIKSFQVNVTDGAINIRFPRNTQSPKVSAIEIMPVTTQTNATTTNTNPVTILIPEANQGTGTLSIIGEPSNGNAVVSGNYITYTPNTGFGGQETIIYMFTDANGSVSISTITVTVTCDNCAKEAIITVSWQPNTETISGYRIYYGPDSANVTVLASDVAVNSGLIDPSAPKLEFLATTDLNFYSGEQVCFKIQAYKDNQNSALSGAICGTI